MMLVWRLCSCHGGSCVFLGASLPQLLSVVSVLRHARRVCSLAISTTVLYTVDHVAGGRKLVSSIRISELDMVEQMSLFRLFCSTSYRHAQVFSAIFGVDRVKARKASGRGR